MTNSFNKRPRSPSPGYFGSLSASYHHQDRVIDSSSSDHHSIKRLEALEAELSKDESLGLRVESRSDEVEGGRLIRLEEDYHNSDSHSLDCVWVDSHHQTNPLN